MEFSAKKILKFLKISLFILFNRKKLRNKLLAIYKILK